VPQWHFAADEPHVCGQIRPGAGGVEDQFIAYGAAE
jgi:hypothetical protein